MRHRPWIIAAALVAATALPAAVIYPAIPAGPVSVSLTPSGLDAVPLPLVGKAGGRGEILASVPRTVEDLNRKTFSIRFGTFLEAPSARIAIQFTDADGKPGTVCRFGPAGYQDALPVTCAVRRSERPARIRVMARGAAGELAVFGSKGPKGRSVGRWTQLASGRSVSARLGFAEGAIDALRPSPFGLPLLILALAVAGALGTVLVASVLVPVEDPGGGEQP